MDTLVHYQKWGAGSVHQRAGAGWKRTTDGEGLTQMRRPMISGFGALRARRPSGWRDGSSGAVFSRCSPWLPQGSASRPRPRRVQRVCDQDRGRRREHLRPKPGDVAFGIGYAQAQDGICLLAETFLTVDGERSAFFGPEGTSENEAEGACSSLTSTRTSTGPRSSDEDTIQKLLKPPTRGPLDEARRSGERLRRRL